MSESKKELPWDAENDAPDYSAYLPEPTPLRQAAIVEINWAQLADLAC